MQIKRAFQFGSSFKKPNVSLNKLSGGMRKISNTVSRILDNPIAQAVISSNPELAGIYGGIRGGSAILGAGAQLTNKKNYSGNVDDVSAQILQRAKVVNKVATNSFV